jgi:hypothetical protein
MSTWQKIETAPKDDDIRRATEKVSLVAWNPIDGWPPQASGEMSRTEAESIAKHYSAFHIRPLGRVLAVAAKFDRGFGT